MKQISYRTPEEQERYKKYLESIPEKECVFCTKRNLDVVFEGIDFYIAKNQFPYTWFDGYEVIDHHLIIPNSHDEYIFQTYMSPQYLNMLRAYSNEGVIIFTRGKDSKNKTIKHVHTHLIKLNYNKPFYLN